jgi:class 3 adenylate cyclase
MTETGSLKGQKKIDSLLNELSNAKKDTSEVRLRAQLSFNNSSINPDKGIQYGLEGLKLAEKLKWKKGLAICYNSLGVNYKAKSNYPKALEYYQNSLEINEKMGDKKGMAFNLGNIGNIYNSQSNYTKALEYHNKALKINEKTGRKNGIAINLGNIGNIYSNLSDYDKSLEYFHRALDIYEEIGSESGKTVIIGNIGGVYLNQGNYSEALDYFHQSLKINEEIGDIKGQAYKLTNLGVLFLTLAKDSIALKKANESKKINLTKDKCLDKAEENLLKAKELFEKFNNLDELSQIYRNLHKIYKERKKFEKAYFALESFKKLEDSVFSQKNNEKIAILEKSREEDLKQKEIEKQKTSIIEQEKRELLILYFSLAIVLLMIIIIIVIVIQRRKSDKLLFNVLPISIAKRLKKKEHPISDYFSEASIVFIDIVNFTELARDANPRRIVEALNKIFTSYDTIAEKYGLEKIKTIGDSYMAAAGIPVVQKDNTLRAANMAIEVNELMKEYYTEDHTKIEVRIGLDCGPVVAGVIGEKKFIYDMWSDAVNTASRMESSSVAGEVQVTERFKKTVSQYHEFQFVERGEIEIKGKGKMKTYFIYK